MDKDRGTDCRDRRFYRLERVCATANAGLWGDTSVMIAAAEMLERERSAETRTE